MRLHRVDSTPGRAGFTLVELLVVIVLLLVLATLAVLFVPRINERRKSAVGAEQVQSALLTAKQRAVRDQAPRGVRIQPVPIVTVSQNNIPAGNQNVTPREMSGTTPTFAETPAPEVVAQAPAGLFWRIQAGSLLVVYDADRLAPDDPELFDNLEIVQVQSVTPTTFRATFTRAHTTYSKGGTQYLPRIKVLAYAQELQYIEQPEDYVVSPPNGPDDNPLRIRPVSVPGNAILNGVPARQAVVLQGLAIQAGKPTPGDFTGGYHFGPGASAISLTTRRPELWPVQPGDYVEVRGGGPVKRILSVTYSLPPKQIPGSNPAEFDGDVLVVDSPFPNPISETRDYRIIRAPRVLPSEPSVKLPKDVAIDLNTNFVYAGFPFAGPLPIDLGSGSSSGTGDIIAGSGSITGTGNIDILFAPNGGVISRGLSSDRINLWIRDASQDPIDPKTGKLTTFEQSLVVTYTRTGFIAAFPVDTTPNGLLYENPYRFVQSGAHSGGL